MLQRSQTPKGLEGAGRVGWTATSRRFNEAKPRRVWKARDGPTRQRLRSASFNEAKPRRVWKAVKTVNLTGRT